MTTALSYTATNPHIAALESVFGRATTPVQGLVIAHNDPRLLNSLSSAWAGRSAAVLHASQDTWNFQRGEFAEAIEWGLQQGDVKELLLVGSSQAGGTASQASLIAAKTHTGADTGYARLLAGIQRHVDRNRELQGHFAGHVRQLMQLPAVETRACAGELAVHGLFYLAESGLFIAYDVNADTFQPLWS